MGSNSYYQRTPLNKYKYKYTDDNIQKEESMMETIQAIQKKLEEQSRISNSIFEWLNQQQYALNNKLHSAFNNNYKIQSPTLLQESALPSTIKQ